MMKNIIHFLSILLFYFTLGRLGHVFILSEYKLSLLLPAMAFAVVIGKERRVSDFVAIFIGGVALEIYNFYDFGRGLAHPLIIFVCALARMLPPLAIAYIFDNRNKAYFYNSWEKFCSFFCVSFVACAVTSFLIFFGYDHFIGGGEFYIGTSLSFFCATFLSVVHLAPLFLYIWHKKNHFYSKQYFGPIELIFISMLFILSFIFTGGHSIFAIHGDLFFLVCIQAFFFLFTFVANYFFFRFLLSFDLKSKDFRHLAISILSQMLLTSFYVSFYLFDFKTGTTLYNEKISLISIFLLFMGLSAATCVSFLFYIYENARISLLDFDKIKKNTNDLLISKSVFLSNMGLEIRNPMNGILGMIEVLEEGSLNNDQKSIVSAIKTSSLSLLSTVNDILDFSRVETDSFKIEHKNFIMKNILGALLTYFNDHTVDKNLTLKIELDERLPRVLKGDGDKIRQILKNLLDNSIKFSNFGDVFMGISLKDVDLSKNAYLIEFKVADQGIGIPKSRLQNIFKPFNSQIDNMKSHHNHGAGLGLVVCQKIVKYMGGDISVESEIGRGTTFKVTLELEKGDLDLEQSHNPDFDISEFSENYPADILVVEDNPINRDVIVRFLERLGYEPEVAQNGKEACEAFRYKNYDLVLMDLQMPILDGMEASKIILKESKGNKRPIIIALTANVYQKDKESCFAIGMSDFLLKPVDRISLQKTLEKHLIIRQMEKGNFK